MALQVKIQLNGAQYTVQLNDSKMAQEFIAMAPFESNVISANGCHYYGSVPKKISLEKKYATSYPHKGGFYYADHLTAQAFFYEEAANISPFIIYHLGDVVDDMLELKSSPSRLTCKVTK